MASKKDAIIAWIMILIMGIVTAMMGYYETAMLIFALAIIAMLMSPDEE